MRVVAVETMVRLALRLCKVDAVDSDGDGQESAAAPVVAEPAFVCQPPDGVRQETRAEGEGVGGREAVQRSSLAAGGSNRTCRR